jgi:sec-independent protein translocase protein TatA
MMFALVGMGPVEMMIIGAIAVILFGSKLPDVARSMGNSYREFRSGLSDFQSHTKVPDYPTNDASSSSTATDEYDEYDDATAPKFSPPPTDSTDEGEQADDDASPLEQRVEQDMADAGENEEAD